MSEFSDKLIYGKNDLQRVVAVETNGPNLVIFQEQEDGSIHRSEIPAKYWFLTNTKISDKQITLGGTQHYKYMSSFTDPEEYDKVSKILWQKRVDNYKVWDKVEQNLIEQGITFFKGMKPSQLSILSFDIETDGLVQHKDSVIYIITNTYRDSLGNITKQAFYLDEYDSQKDMLEDWISFVNYFDPSLIIGHNIFGYDFPYIKHVAGLCGVKLTLGRDGSEIKYDEKASSFRKDGSQSYDYFKVKIFGRQVVDTMFVAIRYDIGRKFPSYGLKPIVKHLGMEKEGRTFIDAGKMKEIYENRLSNPDLWNKSKIYGEEDADDPIKLFDLMIPAQFYFTQSVSKTFQEMCVSATGSQINNMLVRAYLQDGHSIAKATEATEFTGAISYGIPGIYKNAFKQDVSSLYPSIMRQYKIYDETKDPKKYFLELVETFTIDRLKFKKLAKETGDKSYSDLEQSKKVVINSFFGFFGAPGLNYNSPGCAGLITKYGREIITKATIFATGRDVDYWKPVKEEKESKDVQSQND